MLWGTTHVALNPRSAARRAPLLVAVTLQLRLEPPSLSVLLLLLAGQIDAATSH